jgi:TRAP-type mannitol/chloroaromatic compound transport system permease small subunit
VNSEREPSASPSWLDRIVVAMNAIGTLCVLLLVILIVCDALGRTLFNRPIAGMIEIVAVSLAVIVFCQLADTVRLGKLTRSDSFLAQLAGGAMIGRSIVAAFELLGAIVMGLIVVGTVPLLLQSYERGYYIGIRGVFTFPDWPVKAVVVVGAVAALLCFLVCAYRAWQRPRAGEAAEQREGGIE